MDSTIQRQWLLLASSLSVLNWKCSDKAELRFGREAACAIADAGESRHVSPINPG